MDVEYSWLLSCRCMSLVVTLRWPWSIAFTIHKVFFTAAVHSMTEIDSEILNHLFNLGSGQNYVRKMLPCSGRERLLQHSIRRQTR